MEFQTGWYYSGLTSNQLQSLSRVALCVESRMATVADLADQSGGQSLSVSSQQHTETVLQGQRQGGHLHLLLHWKET